MVNKKNERGKVKENWNRMGKIYSPNGGEIPAKRVY
jgi:hypothetical protein